MLTFCGFYLPNFVMLFQLHKPFNSMVQQEGEDQLLYGFTGLGEVRWVLDMLVERDRAARAVYISQEAFINSILARFHLADATQLSTPLAPGAQCFMKKFWT
jgi:hypothetical protein